MGVTPLPVEHELGERIRTRRLKATLWYEQRLIMNEQTPKTERFDKGEKTQMSGAGRSTINESKQKTRCAWAMK